MRRLSENASVIGAIVLWALLYLAAALRADLWFR